MDVTEDVLKVSRRIRAERERKNLSQMELAYRAEISTGYLGMVELGKKHPTVVTLVKLAKAMEISPAVFFESSDPNIRAVKEQLIDYIKTQL